MIGFIDVGGSMVALDQIEAVSEVGKQGEMHLVVTVTSGRVYRERGCTVEDFKERLTGLFMLAEEDEG
jgi:hypothetical protein